MNGTYVNMIKPVSTIEHCDITALFGDTKTVCKVLGLFIVFLTELSMECGTYDFDINTTMLGDDLHICSDCTDCSYKSEYNQAL